MFCSEPLKDRYVVNHMYQEGGMVDVHLKGETIHTDESCTHGSLCERKIPLVAINPAAPAEEYRYHMDIVRHLLANLEGPGCRPLASSRRPRTCLLAATASHPAPGAHRAPPPPHAQNAPLPA